MNRPPAPTATPVDPRLAGAQVNAVEILAEIQRTHPAIVENTVLRLTNQKLMAIIQSQDPVAPPPAEPTPSGPPKSGKCSGVTGKGKRCGSRAAPGSAFCGRHQAQEGHYLPDDDEG